MSRVYYHNSHYTVTKKDFERIIESLKFTDIIPKVGRIQDIIKEQELNVIKCAMSHYYKGFALYAIEIDNGQKYYFLDTPDNELIKVAIDF